jgi:pimeloyl-ACP methyl ester carboxylesterase
MSFKNALDGYQLPAFNEPLRICTFPNGDYATTYMRSYIELPATYNASNTAKVCMEFHGSGGSDLGALAYAPLETVKNTLTADGYVFVSSLAEYNNWGNASAVNDYNNLSTYLQNNFNVYPRYYLLGQSMGGMSSNNYALTHPDNVACIALVSPVLNLDWAYSATHTSDFSVLTSL